MSTDNWPDCVNRVARCGLIAKTVGSATSLNLLAIAGLLYDIAGAALIALAIIGTKHEALLRQARQGGQFSSANLAQFGALEEQRHDARFGLALLVSGFGLQLAAACGFAMSPTWPWSIAFVIAGAGCLVAWWLSRRRMASTRRQRVADSLEGIDRLNFLTRNPPE